MDLTEFYAVFYEEAEELLASMEKLLLELDLSAPSIDELNGIFRVAHSIKGGAATFGMPEITELTHVLESLLDRLRKSELRTTSEHVDTFLKAKDILQEMIAARRNGGQLESAASAAIMVSLNDLAQRQASAAGGEPATATAAIAPAPPTTLAAPTAPAAPPEDDLEALFDEVSRDAGFTAGAPAPQEIVDNAAQRAAENAARENESLLDRAMQDESFGLFEPLVAPVASEPAKEVVIQTPHTQATPAAGKSPEAQPAKNLEKNRATTESSTLRVGVEKIDELINLVGELVITHAMINQLSKSLDAGLHERLINSVGQLARNTRELQNSVLSIRMLPVEVVFSRFPRMVRDLAAKLGKKIDLITTGASTELDKSLTERLVDPLTHLVRNSIDHGIESPEQRRASGKSETGKLTLSAAHQGGCIIIEVADDGAGLNRERILAKARQQGISVSDDMKDEEVWQLIFAPGFSTAEHVTDVSGRGVGMDVVKRNITAMGGSVEIRSAKGFGSNIRIALPLTLAILDGMLVKVGGEIYILALSSIVESLQPSPSAVKEVMGDGVLLRVRDEYLPVLYLHQMFGIDASFTDPSKGVVVILESEGRKVGLMVDELVGQQQVVVKSLETNYRRVTGISGATVLGDGSVALILDVPTLLRQSRQAANELTLTQ